MSKEQELEALCLDRLPKETALIEQMFSKANGGKEAILQMGVEMEVATASKARPDGTFPDVDYAALQAYAKDEVPTLTKVKTEGQAWVFFRHTEQEAWFRDGNANPAHRFFVVDLPPEQIYGEKDGKPIISEAPRRLLRREIMLGHDNVRPVQSVLAANKMQEVTLRYLAEECTGIRGSFDPKFLEPEVARKLVNVESAVMWLHFEGKLQGDLNTLRREIRTLEDLEQKAGIYFAGMPGNGDQNNLSVKLIDGQNAVTYGMFDPETMDGNDMAYRMQLGFITVANMTSFPFNQTNSSYRRLNRGGNDPIAIASDMAEARPATITHGETKFGGFFAKFSPYTAEGNALIASMAGQRGASYLEPRQPDGSNFRQEGRGGDQSGLRALRVLTQVAGDRYGMQVFADKNAAEIKALLLDHSNARRLPATLGEAVARHEKGIEFFGQLVGEDIAQLSLEVARENLMRPAKDAGVEHFLTGRRPG